MPSKASKLKGSERAEDESFHIKLDKRILTALKRESAARGGGQERRITEEALILHLGLRSVLRGTGFTGISGSATEARHVRKYSRIVE
ncbi:MAG TPA: hypothetical protein VK673_15455 [Chthoniobacterales bacterium]|nr:hypothetical protein [Chthoniobacterales bacterium]